jgi:hypothetical protein
VGTGALTTLATNATSPRTRGDWVAWAEEAGYGGFGGTVWARNLRTGVTRLVAGGVPDGAQVVGIVDGPAVVFAGDRPAPISQRLYVAPLTP